MILTKAIPPLENIPVEILELDWDDDNIQHIAIHGISPDEVEDAAFDDAPWIKKGRKGTRYMLGYTAGGRYLFIVYVLKGKGIARVVTARDMDDRTRRAYKKRGML